jgi:hypothetical protein
LFFERSGAEERRGTKQNGLLKTLIPVIDEMIGCGAMMTIEKAEIIRYTSGKEASKT